MIEQQTAIAPQPQTQQNVATIRDVLRNPNFVKLWAAQILSQTAQQIVNYALVLQVANLTNSSTAVSGIIIAFTVPAILFAAIAGVFVERNSKKTMLTLTNLARGIMVLGYLFTNPEWGVGAVLPIFYIITLLFSAVSQFFNPAEASMIPLVVSREELVPANSLFNLTLPAAQLGGFVVLGPLLLSTVFHNNYNGLYIVIFILCLAAAGITYFLPQDRPDATAAERRKKGEKVGVGEVAAGATEIARKGYREAGHELAEGWNFIRRDPVIMSAIIYWSIAIAVFMMLGTIGPTFLTNIGIEQSKLFYILLPGGVGLVLGVLVVGRIARPDNREAMINISLLAAGAALVLFALLYPVLRWAYTALGKSEPPETLVLAFLGILTLLLGFFNSFISVPAQTALQERSPEQIRARVFSAFFTISNAILIVPVFFAGALGDWLGYAQAIFGIGMAVILIASFGLYRSRHRRTAGRVAVPDTNTGSPQNGRSKRYITQEEAEAALTAGSPAPRPLLAKEQQQAIKEEEPAGERK
ncbi:MAG: MFS transporter [Chloroflexota bacterium]